MSYIFYIAYSSNLSEEDKLIMDKEVLKNRKNVYKNIKTFILKTKGIFVFGSIFFGYPQASNSMNINNPPKIAIQSDYKESFQTQVSAPVSKKLKKLIFIDQKVLPRHIYLIDERLIKTSSTIKIINKVRGGSLIQATVALILIITIWQIFEMIPQTQGFVNYLQLEKNRPNNFLPPGGHLNYPPVRDLFHPKRPYGYSPSGSIAEVVRPSAIPHQEFVALTKEQKRHLPHEYDREIISEGRPKLSIKFWQARYKTPKHGPDHGLDYTVTPNGKRKTAKTDENTLKLMESLVQMPNRNNVRWFENGTYKGGRERGFKAIFIYDLDEQVIAVYKDETREFVTTCKLSPIEHDLLLETGNFCSSKAWVQSQVDNFASQQTLTNTFESDVMQVNPINLTDENSSTGSTPINSFESDIMDITPIDKSQFDT